MVYADDPWHRRCAAASTLSLPLDTSEGVLTEVFHLANQRFGDADRAWGVLRSGVATIFPIGDSDLGHIAELMRRYGDRPMDFTDATLVHLAGRENLSTIFTVDHADFRTYRIQGHKTFRILPEPEEMR